MKIIGIDPGTARVGWALIESQNVKLHPVYGCISTDQTLPPEIRLLKIQQELKQIIDKFHPECMSLEDLFFATNAKTAIAVGQARGVILLTAAIYNLPVISYTPLAVKLTICGDGKADKDQVAKMVKLNLNENNIPGPDDITDALAIALTHAYSYKLKGKLL